MNTQQSSSRKISLNLKIKTTTTDAIHIPAFIFGLVYPKLCETLLKHNMIQLVGITPFTLADGSQVMVASLIGTDIHSSVKNTMFIVKNKINL